MAPGRACRGLLALAAALLLCEAGLQAADAIQTKPVKAPSSSRWRLRKQPKAAARPAPGSHLFHQGEDALSYDNDEFTRLRELHQRSYHDKEAYLRAPNLASYLGLTPVEAMHMAVPLNFLFVGFQRDGNQRVTIEQDELAAWFQHLDHVMPHTRVALSELTCSEDGHCAGQMEASIPPSPLHSYVHLNFSCNVLVVRGHDVLETFERAIAAFSRPVDPDSPQGDQQVDALQMEAFIDGFLASLGVSSAYTVLVINPKWSQALPAYGYRIGFSDKEVAALAEQTRELQSMATHHIQPEPQPPKGDSMLQRLWGGMSTNKFKVSGFAQESDDWVLAASSYLKRLEDHKQRLTRALRGKRVRAPAAFARALALMHDIKGAHAEHRELGRLLTTTLAQPPKHVHNPAFGASHPLSDCPTPNWVGHGRWLLLDLTAAHSDWGPSLGGDGVVTRTTLPDVASAFAELQDARAVHAAEQEVVSAEQQHLADTLHVMKSQRLAQIAMDQQNAHSQQMRHGAVQGVAPGADVDPDGRPIHAGELEADTEARHNEAMLQAELDVYEDFAMRHCFRRTNAPPVCAEAEERVTSLKHELSLAASASGRPLHAYREHRWDIFGSMLQPELDPATAATPSINVTSTAVVLKDRFLASLGAVLARGIRHVIAPPTATWHHKGYLHDTATPYAHKVHFTLYQVIDTSRHLHEPRHLARTRPTFDIEAFRTQLGRLQLAGQSFSHSTVVLNLLDDPALAVAFSAAMRTTFAQVPHAMMEPVEHEALYLDSQELAWRLRRRFLLQPRRPPADPHASLEVPIFVFELDRPMAVLIDEHYNGKALEDMVLVVQNAAHMDEHPTGMMCNGALLSRPLSPLKAALQATLQHLGGVLPPHLGYSPSRHAVQHDWLWSVGAHPLSWTSPGSTFSQLSIDALHRSYMLDALDASAQGVNGAIEVLQRQGVSEAGWEHVPHMQDRFTRLLTLFSQVISMWRVAANHCANIDYGAASHTIYGIERLTAAFVAEAAAIQEHLHPKHCAARTGVGKQLITWLCVASGVMGCLALLLACLPRLRKKSKAI